MIGNASIGYQKEQDVFIQSNTSNLFQAFLQTYDKEDITLTNDISVDDESIDVSSGHGITTGDMLIIYDENYFWQVEAIGVTVDNIQVEAPSYLSFSSSNTTIIRGNPELNVDGSTTDVKFKFGIPSPSGSPIDITKAIIIMSHSADSDDSKYGGIAALTNGFLIRKENSIKFNFGVYRTNRDYKLYNGEVVPTQKAPAGEYGTEIRYKLQGQENFDQVVRIKYGDFITGTNRDNLSTLLYKRFVLIGSYTTGE